MYQKNFDAWNVVKKGLDENAHSVHIRAGEIRWVSIGVNVGSEIDGKGLSFTRPALILHVIGSHLALIIPLSTKVKPIAGYLPFEWKGRTTALCIHQARVVSQKRILSRKGKIADDRLKAIRTDFKKFFAFE